MQRKRKDEAVFRITGARQSLDDDVRARQRRYVISMLIRTASVILAVVLWNIALPLAVVALAAGVLLPYIAVVIANAGRENASNLPSEHFSPSRPALETPRGGQEDREDAGASPEGAARPVYEGRIVQGESVRRPNQP